ncbi:MAG: patatin-like phospholipase RssA [Steroidobacteraceae bacterium]|nr:patatin-like phospholipase RssA [Steroidobacteraceae bacterium]
MPTTSPAEPRTAPRLGIALGSGSARGWSHIGILQGLVENGLAPAVVTGSSVGAMVAAAYASGQLAGLEAWVRTLTQLDVWRLVDTTFSGGGVMTGNRLMQAIGQHVQDRSIESLPIAFGAVATELDTGQEVWLREGSMLAAVRASSGLPGIFAPVKHQGRWMIDGGVVNPVPVSLCRALGADVVVAVNLNKRVDTVRARAKVPAEVASATAEEAAERSALTQRWAALVEGLMGRLRSATPDEPGFFEVMSASVRIMQDRITQARMAGDVPDLVLAPELDHFQLMDFHRAAEAIEVGRAAAAASAPQIAALLKPAA